MAKPRTPTNVLRLRGVDKVHPGRMAERANEPIPVGELVDPPEGMPEEVVARWREIVRLAHKGVLCEVDALIVEQTAYLLHELRTNSWKVHPTIMGRYEACLGKLGMTPADRSRVSAVKPKDTNADPLGEFQAAG